MALIMMVFSIAPSFAPVIGGWLQATFGWHSVFIMLTSYGLVLWLLWQLGIPETLPKAQRMPLQLGRIVGNYGKVLCHRVFILRVLSIAMIFIGMTPFDKAVEGAQKGILFNQGQVCCAGSRIFVQETIYDKFITALKEEFKKVKVGLPWEDDTQMGAQVNENQIKVITKYVDIAKEEGCEIILGGSKATDPILARGEFFQPTLILAPDNKKRVAQEEIFGPVAVVIKFKDEADVIQMANDSDYGLGGAVWTYNINRALRVAKALEIGRVWVNCYNRLPAGAPFGGYKTSGIGRETHKMMLAAYTQVKNIFISTREEREGMY